MNLRRKAAASLMLRFISGDIGETEWDDFISISDEDPMIECIRKEVGDIPTIFPPYISGHYSSPEGLTKIMELARALEAAS